jgi:hypothetical protein
MIKESILVLALALVAIAQGGDELLEVPFKSQKEKVLVKILKSNCTSSGPRAYQLKTVEDQIHFDLVCTIAEPSFNSTTPVRLIKDFKFPKTIVSSDAMKRFPEIKKQGSRAIRIENHPWGREYWWNTPTIGSSRHSYLCMKGAKTNGHCYYVVHGGIEILELSLAKL